MRRGRFSKPLVLAGILGACSSGTGLAAPQDRSPATTAPRADVAVGFTMQTPADVNVRPQCVELALPCGTPRTFPDFGLALSSAAYLGRGAAIVGEASIFDNTWYSSLTKAGKESNVVRLLLGGVRLSAAPPAVGGGKARGVRLFGQVLAGGEWSTVQATTLVIQPGGGIDAKLSNGPTVRIELDYDVVHGPERNLSGARVFVGLVRAVGR